MTTSERVSVDHCSACMTFPYKRPARSPAACLTIIGALVLLGAPMRRAVSQGLRPKLALAGTNSPGCSKLPAPNVVATPAAPAAEAEARQLVEAAQDAALQGEHAQARDAFAKASQLTPQNSRLSYYLAREHEAMGNDSAAVRQYCRYLALSPAAPDGDEVRGRVVRLVPARDLTRLEEARGSFRAGVALLQRRQYSAADSAFGVVATSLPTAPEPYYNRALSRAARGARASALEDFEKYLELAPGAPDRNAVRSTMAQLPERLYRPASALGSGLVLPGLGQMNTGRPIFGVVLLGVAGGAATFAVTAKHSTEVRTFQLPFGGGTYTERVPVTSHPNLVTGGVALAVVWLGGALEASAFARRSRAKAEGVLDLRAPAVKASSPGAAPESGLERESGEASRLALRARPDRDRPRVAVHIAPTPRGTALGMRVAFGGAPAR